LNTIKVGIIGAGRIGYVHAKSITYEIPGAEVKTIADMYMNDTIKAWAAELGIKNCVNDAQAIFDDPEISAVLVCSSTDTHSEFSIKAAKAGKNVFCEKPVDSSISRIREVLAVIEETGVNFQVGFNRRFDHNFMTARKAVEDGRIGTPQMLRITSRDPEPPSAEYAARSGGLFFDMAIHDFDMARYQAGCEVTEVYAKGAVLVDPAIGEAGDIDSAIITLTFENGMIGVIENCRKAAYGYDQRVEILGSEGSVATENDRPSTTVISTAASVESEKPLFFFLERYMASFTREKQEFFKVISEGGTISCNGKDGLESVRIAVASKKSLDEGRPVKLSEIE